MFKVTFYAMERPHLAFVQEYDVEHLEEAVAWATQHERVKSGEVFVHSVKPLQETPTRPYRLEIHETVVHDIEVEVPETIRGVTETVEYVLNAYLSGEHATVEFSVEDRQSSNLREVG